MSDAHKNTVLITGAAKRIGKAIALGMAADGWRVVLHYGTSQLEAESVVQLICDNGGDAVALHADLCDEEQTGLLIPSALKIAGPISCLINNASLFEEDSVQTASCESWNTHMQINLRSPFVLIQALRDQLPEGLKGNVINIVDQCVVNLTPHFLSYRSANKEWLNKDDGAIPVPGWGFWPASAEDQPGAFEAPSQSL